MKYMLLIFSNPSNPHFSGDELEAVVAEVGALMEELAESGEWIGGEALADPAQAKTVKVRDGSPVITDGPFAEAKEHLAGYCLFDCETEQAPRVLAPLARRHRDFGECGEALQEALLAAAVRWPRDGTPDDPRAWLIAVASRRPTDALRSRGARRRREEEVAARAAREDAPATGPGGDPGAEPESGPLAGDDRDDSLELLFL